MTREIKCRQLTENGTFHYWGYVSEGIFNGPIAGIESSQYTGLKDKNGREIYEGDIVEFLGENWTVIYFEQYAQFMLQRVNDLANITTQEVIIGNQFENPELLNGL